MVWNWSWIDLSCSVERDAAMNRILVEAREIVQGHVVLYDSRADHIRDVLRAVAGDQIKVGVADGLIGVANVLRCETAEVELALSLVAEAPAPWCDLVLAMPRPRVFKRLLPQIAAMGVGRLWLVGAARVEKCYFGSHWLRPEVYRPLLVEGLMQAGTTQVPEVYIEPRLSPFVTHRLASLVAGADAYLAHPGAGTTVLPPAVGTVQRRAMLAIGPEGGWLDDELALFQAQGFRPLSLGPRILRSDTACVSLLAVLARAYDSAAHDEGASTSLPRPEGSGARVQPTARLRREKTMR